ncbi:hypothetical protein [Alicyclobacillus acidiphilus]|uniref:hypothetical protein n=1 Tax=Alicyclobacillus acidiphilus TaxID=182455 RepID=UPI00082B1C30|nr:hypothetical protein [Alicyclobacillus acidiphilus]
MFGGWLETLHVALALLFSGAAVKLMDDALDAEFDLCQGKRTLAARLGRAALPYSLAMLAIGVALNPGMAFAAFFGSYAVGMFARPGEQLPTRLPAWVEIVAAIAISVLLVGWRDTLWGVAMMAVVDWLDDVMDRYRDAQTGQFNVVVRFGLIEVLFALLGMFCVALYADIEATIFAFIVLVILNIVSELTTVRILVHDEEASESW